MTTPKEEETPTAAELARRVAVLVAAIDAAQREMDSPRQHVPFWPQAPQARRLQRRIARLSAEAARLRVLLAKKTDVPS